MKQEKIVAEFLEFLEVEKREASIDFLNDLIKSHQLKVRWENLTKILDYERGYKQEDFLPPLELYFRRIMDDGYGGLCWTISIGFHWFLKQLGFDVHYLYMDPGHLCLRVDLDQPYYVDLGFCAPLFQAYPLYKSFTVKNSKENFEYTISEEGEITVVRTPGPTKTLHTTPVTIEDMLPKIKRSNNWATSFVLKDIRIFGYLDGVPTSITNDTLKQHFSEQVMEQILNEEELKFWITERFKMNYDLYVQAMEIFERRRVLE